MKPKNWQLSFFRREQRSLFGEILDWMLTPLLLLWPVSLALTWLVAQGLANKPFDRALIYNAQALAQLVKLSPDQQRIQFNLPQPASELLRADDADLVYYQVIGPKGELLGGDRDLPQPQDEEKLGSYEVKIRDDEMRSWKCAWPTHGCRLQLKNRNWARCWFKSQKRVKNDRCWPLKLSRA